MTNAERIAAYLALKAEEKRLKAKIEAAALEIQAAMVEAGTFTITTEAGTAKLSEVAAKRFDTKSFKADHAALYAAYTVSRSETRFTVR